MTRDEFSEYIMKEVESVIRIPYSKLYTKAIDLIYKRVHEMDGKVIITGIGKAGQVGINIATTLSSTGTPAIYIHPTEAQHGDLGMIQKNDIIILISNSGKTREVLEFKTLVDNLYKDIPHIVITGNIQSDLAVNADIFLSTGNPEEICPLKLTPTTSTTTMMVIGDILVVGLMKKCKFNKSDYYKRHHGGYLGKKSKN